MEVVVCNVNKKVKELVEEVVDEVMRVEENIYKGFEVDEKLRMTFALIPQNS